jgi:hypothetical protein
MSSLDCPEQERLLALLRAGRTSIDAARDPVIAPHLAGYENAPRQVRRLRAHFQKLGLLDPPPLPPEYQEMLAGYEDLLGLPPKRAFPAVSPDLAGDRQYLVFGDTHNPCQRKDLLARMCALFPGLPGILGGDVDDWEAFSRWDLLDPDVDDIRTLLRDREAMIAFLMEHLASLTILFGNHDVRPWKKANQILGKNYAWMTKQFLAMAYEARHGVSLVKNPVTTHHGRPIPNMHFWYQVGDCVVTHVEKAGQRGWGVIKTHEWLQAWGKHIGLQPFRVVLHFHTHRRHYQQCPITGRHLFEVGCMTDIQSYSCQADGKYFPPQRGFFLLAQTDGVTDINACRFVALDE